MKNRDANIAAITAGLFTLTAVGLLGLIVLTIRKENEHYRHEFSGYKFHEMPEPQVILIKVGEINSGTFSLLDAVQSPKDLLSIDTIVKQASGITEDWEI